MRRGLEWDMVGLDHGLPGQGAKVTANWGEDGNCSPIVWACLFSGDSSLESRLSSSGRFWLPFLV